MKVKQVFCISLIILSIFILYGDIWAQNERTVGLMLNESYSTGYKLFATFTGNTYLINNLGKLVHSWDYAGTVYLRENGNLLSTYRVPTTMFVNLGGPAGGLREVDWDGNIVWEFEHACNDYVTHHDYELLPNGNVLMIAWEVITKEKAIAAGRDPDLDLEDVGLWPEKIIEVEPTPPLGGNIVSRL